MIPRGRQKLIREIQTRDALRFGEDKPVRMQVGTVLAVDPEGANIQLQDREIRQVIVHGGMNVNDNVLVFWAGRVAIAIGESDGSGGGGSGDYLPLTGGTLSGPLYLPSAAPTNPVEAANKQYVDDQIAAIELTPGPPGEAEEWHSGTGAPAVGLGSTGDFYLNNTNGDVYEKIGEATWILRTNIQGPPGSGGGGGGDSPHVIDPVEPVDPVDGLLWTHPDENLYDPSTLNGYTFIQGVASSIWTINHVLPFQPNVAVVDSAGEQVEGEVTYVDSDTITVEFSAAFVGKAYLS